MVRKGHIIGHPLGTSDKISAQVRKNISRSVIAWYLKHHRTLPFRNTQDPYSILVSEIMLQQTQVATVIPYYEKFVEQYPTVGTLAEAAEQDVMAAWAGLGYYRRARMLQAAARDIMQKHDGQFPQELSQILALPGIGRYTAGAVYSFAYNKPAPIVEANTARLLSRLFLVEGPLSASLAQRQLWGIAEHLLPDENARLHNYGLMELGALICRPRPLCGDCPLTSCCQAFKEGLQLEIPRQAIKPAKIQRAFAGLVLQWNDKFLLREIGAGEWHAGLYEFPTVPIPHPPSQHSEGKAVRALLKKLEITARPEPFARFQYVVTRHAVTLGVWKARAQNFGAHSLPSGLNWYTREQVERLPLGSAQKKLFRLLIGEQDLLVDAL